MSQKFKRRRALKLHGCQDDHIEAFVYTHDRKAIGLLLGGCDIELWPRQARALRNWLTKVLPAGDGGVKP
jgi:hypothetical protein